MAKLSSFLGIILSMEKEDCERHKGPHVHAWYSGYAASFNACTGKIFACGKRGFPEKQARWIRTWIEIHQEELAAAWEMLKRGINPPEIPPLVR